MATTGTPSRTPASTPPAKGRRNKPRRKRNPFWYAVKQCILGMTLLVLVALITFLVAFALQMRNAPSSIDLTFDPAGLTQIYSSDGVLLAKLYTQNRQRVEITDIPKDLQNATVAFEDKRFYTHSGIDMPGIGRAIWQNVKHGDVRGQGGSTLTQQLARNMGVAGLGNEKTIGRKMHEMLVAAQIEKSYTKQDILGMYLNQVYYGAGAYGVQAAARTYFGKDVSKCDLAQCALLAGLPNQPYTVSPYRNKKAAEAQRNRVLDNMFQQNYITAQQCAQAKAEYIHLAAPKAPKQGNQIFHAPYFVNYVIDQMRQKYGPDYLMRGNLRVETTLNWPMQQAAEDALVQGIRDAGGRGPTQGCLVCLDQKTGQIKAMVGGVDYAKSQYNIVTQARRQPGSSFKAVVYAAAIDSHVVTEDTRVYDAPQTYNLGGGKTYTPHDDTRPSYNHVTLRTAMAYSINIPAVSVIHLLGPRTAVQYARLMGVTSPLDPVLSLALGSSGVTPLEMATVYATIASGGNHPEPTPFTRLADDKNQTIEDLPPTVETRVLQPSTVKQLDDMLRAVVTEPRGTGANVAEVAEARGKTGTTQGHKDVWFVGYDPNLVCAVWAGHPVYTKDGKAASYGEEMEGNAWGSTVCAPIWKNFMLRAVPIFQAAKAREAARDKPADKSPVLPPAVVQSPTADTGADGQAKIYRHHRRRPADVPPADDTSTTDTPALDAANSDNGTDTAPTDSGSSPDNGSTDNTLSTPTPAAAGSAPGTGGEQASPSQPAVVELPKKRSSPHVNRSAAHNASPATVTVRINPEDGKLATQWTPEVVERTYVKGKEPRAYSHMYGPPPGEQ